jgi:asparagine synthetase A
MDNKKLKELLKQTQIDQKDSEKLESNYIDLNEELSAAIRGGMSATRLTMANDTGCTDSGCINISC